MPRNPSQSPPPQPQPQPTADFSKFGHAIDSAERKFCALRTIVDGVATAKLRHLIVIGPQGVGKTHAIGQALDKRMGECRYNKITGHIAPLALYQTLYDNRRPDEILILDDCDSIFKNVHAANLIKAATDTGETRRVSWVTSSKQIPAKEFVFNGRIIVCTNHKPVSQFAGPVLDRFMPFNLTLSSAERVARVITVLNAKYRSDPQASPILDDILGYLINHQDELGEDLSLRTAIKLVELATFTPEWRQMAAQTVLGY